MTSTVITERDRADRAEAAAAPSPWTDRLYITLLAVSVLGVLSQITLGGVVRVTNSGDGCPDWPQCFGRWIPPADYHAILEWSHRSTGTFVGIVMFLVLLRTIQRYRANRALTGLTLAGFILVGVVGIIGGQVVLNDLDPAIRTLHLGLAEMVLLIMLIVLVVAATPVASRVFDTAVALDGRTVGKIAAIAAVVTLVALLSGAYAVWRNAGGVCGSWPLCGGPVIPEVELRWIHMTHRLLAGIGALAAAYAAFRAQRLDGASRVLKGSAHLVLTVAAAQVLIGAANPWTDFDTWARAAHLSMATIMWAVTALIAILIWLAISRDSGPPPEQAVE